LLVQTPSPSHLSTLSLHDALPISGIRSSPSTTSTRSGQLSGHGTCAIPESPTLILSFLSRTTIRSAPAVSARRAVASTVTGSARSEEHTSELQSRSDLVCRLLLEK